MASSIVRSKPVHRDAPASEGAHRGQSTLLPECLEDWIDNENPVRVIDAFVDALELGDLGFDGVEPAATGRPAYHPAGGIHQSGHGGTVGDAQEAEQLPAPEPASFGAARNWPKLRLSETQ